MKYPNYEEKIIVNKKILKKKKSSYKIKNPVAQEQAEESDLRNILRLIIGLSVFTSPTRCIWLKCVTPMLNKVWLVIATV